MGNAFDPNAGGLLERIVEGAGPQRLSWCAADIGGPWT